jgi:tRNA (guanine37-N1)-methyltransferase
VIERAALAWEVVTLFPELVRAHAEAGVFGRALRNHRVEVHTTDPRDFAADPRRSVDDAPFGGGAGMVMAAGPIVGALEAIERSRGPAHKILLTPSAPTFDDAVARRLCAHDRIALVCGRYEGVDERVRAHYVDEALSIGDFVLNGGELAALVVIEAVTRLRVGVVGNPATLHAESHHDAPGSFGALLEHPQYTRPEEFRGARVPAVLVGGDHEAIRRARLAASVTLTRALRPELRARVQLPARLWAAWPRQRGDLSRARREVRERAGEPWLLGTPETAAGAEAAFSGLADALDYLRVRDGVERRGALIVSARRMSREAGGLARRLDAAVLAPELEQLALADVETLIDISPPASAGPAAWVDALARREGFLS